MKRESKLKECFKIQTHFHKLRKMILNVFKSDFLTLRIGI